MDLLRTDVSPWGQEVLLGISWDLLPVFAGAGALLIVLHALYKALWGAGGPKAPRPAAARLSRLRAETTACARLIASSATASPNAFSIG